MPSAAIVSFRLGGTDGVSIEAAKWAWALRRLGYGVHSVAGTGTADRLVPGLATDAPEPPGRDELESALATTDVVVVENLCSLPLNPAAASAVAACLAGRPAVLHHHDLPWQRPLLADRPGPPDDPAWRHVTINRRSRRELADRGIRATTLYNAFDPAPPPGRRAATRAALGVGPTTPVVLQPTRALTRKRVGAAIGLAERLDAAYWLLGPAEDGYGPELDRLLGAARCPVRHGPVPLPPGPVTRTAPGGALPGDVADAYAACDVVALPSSWEGFGNPAIESATHKRPLAIGPYPVASELVDFGFEWFDVDGADTAGVLARWCSAPDEHLLAHNAAIARRFFSIHDLPDRLAAVLSDLGVGG